LYKTQLNAWKPLNYNFSHNESGLATFDLVKQGEVRENLGDFRKA